MLAPFTFAGRVSRSVLAAFLAVNAVVATNVVIHDRRVGYDSSGHLAYIHSLGRGELPSADDSDEFFNAPLPYAIPAAARLVGVSRNAIIEKIAQGLNLVYALLLTYFLIKLCRRIRPDDPQFATWSLVLLGALPVFHRTMAFVRGEPLAAALAVVACERVLAVYARPTPRALLGVGALLGLLLMAKHWGAFIVAAVFAFAVLRLLSGLDQPRRFVINVAFMTAAAVPMGGWFYLYLDIRFGSAMVFNGPPTVPSSVRSDEFFTAFPMFPVFSAPIRSSFPTPLLAPILYSDTWGDYWCYFLVTGMDARGAAHPGETVGDPGISSNTASMAPALGRANVAGLIPSALFAAGIVAGGATIFSMVRRRGDDESAQAVVLCTLAAAATAAGFVVALVTTPALDAKASYVMQMFPFLAVLSASVLGRLRERAPSTSIVARIVLAIALAHNLPLLFSRYSVLGGFDGLPISFT